MILAITLNYIMICCLCCLCAGWMIIKVLREQDPFVDGDNNDGSGGIPADYHLPVFDPPGGCHLDDLLVDRLPEDMQELNSRRQRTDQPVRLA